MLSVVVSPAPPAAPAKQGWWAHRSLWLQLTRREVESRYRSTALGFLWSLLTPLLMLAVFAVVFGLIFEGRFTGHPQESKADFALALFAGMIVFNFFAEALARAPTLITSTPSYVTKVVFPLEVLPVASVASGLVHLALSLVPLLAFTLLLRGSLPWTLLEWPLLLVPLVGWALAVSWTLAALGVFLRDLVLAVSTVNLVLMYASAIFYPLEKVPADFYGWPLRALVELNPLAFLASASRDLAIWGTPLAWVPWAKHSAVALLAAWLAQRLFRRARPAFADVL